MSESMNVREGLLAEARMIGDDLGKLRRTIDKQNAIEALKHRIKFLLALANSGRSEMEMISDYISETAGGEFDTEIDPA